jgi:hypothetical protein
MSKADEIDVWKAKAEDVLTFLESLYTWECSEEEWLRQLRHAATVLVDTGIEATAYTYEASEQGFRAHALSASARLAPYFGRFLPFIRPEMTARSYRSKMLG